MLNDPLKLRAWVKPGLTSQPTPTPSTTGTVRAATTGGAVRSGFPTAQQSAKAGARRHPSDLETLRVLVRETPLDPATAPFLNRLPNSVHMQLFTATTDLARVIQQFSKEPEPGEERREDEKLPIFTDFAGGAKAIERLEAIVREDADWAVQAAVYLGNIINSWRSNHWGQFERGATTEDWELMALVSIPEDNPDQKPTDRTMRWDCIPFLSHLPALQAAFAKDLRL